MRSGAGIKSGEQLIKTTLKDYKTVHPGRQEND